MMQTALVFTLTNNYDNKKANGLPAQNHTVSQLQARFHGGGVAVFFESMLSAAALRGECRLVCAQR
jgi:hypothetical protein